MLSLITKNPQFSQGSCKCQCSHNLYVLLHPAALAQFTGTTSPRAGENCPGLLQSCTLKAEAGHNSSPQTIGLIEHVSLILLLKSQRYRMCWRIKEHLPDNIHFVCELQVLESNYTAFLFQIQIRCLSCSVIAQLSCFTRQPKHHLTRFEYH